MDALFSPAELAELPQQEPIKGEPQIGALKASQIGTLTVSQTQFFTPAQMGALSPAQLAALTLDSTAALEARRRCGRSQPDRRKLLHHPAGHMVEPDA